MTATPESATTPTTASDPGPIAASERLHVLDILRGFAILGMFIVHFTRFAWAGGYQEPVGSTIYQAMVWFGHPKAWGMFVILFGVSFAIQFRRADSLGVDVPWRFLRRLIGVAAFGVVTAALVGAIDLIGMAISGVCLLFVRRWSTRALLIALLASVVLGGLWNIAVGSYQWATLGTDGANTVYQSPLPVSPAQQAADEEYRAAKQGTSFARLAVAAVVARIIVNPKYDLWGDWKRGKPGLLLSILIGGAT